MEDLVANSPDQEPPQGADAMQTQLKRIYEDLLAQRVSKQEALARIQALKSGAAVAGSAALLAVPGWQPQAAPVHRGPPFASRHIVLCGPLAATAAALAAAVPGSHCVAWPAAAQDAAQAYLEHARLCFSAVQELLRKPSGGRVLLQIVVADDTQALLLAGLAGLLRTAALESPHFAGQMVFVGPDTGTQALARLLQAEAAVPHETLVRHQGGQRLVQRWQLRAPPSRPAPLAFKERGVYLVTGGLGALGRLLAREILQQTRHGRVVLTGRQPLAAQRVQQLQQLQQLQAGHGGDRLSYRQLDLQDAQAVQALVQQVLQSHGALHGVLHAAGMTADNFILKKNLQEFEHVLAPKVRGTWNLGRATQALDLDFLLLYSSVAAAMGNLGQADYAAANGFMDQYAVLRNAQLAQAGRHGHVLSVNWSLWQDGGIGIDAQSLAVIRQDSGLRPLQTSAALPALQQALALGGGRCLITEGDGDRVLRWLTPTAPPELPPPLAAAGPLPRAAAAPEGLARQTEQYLCRQLAAVLKLPAQRLDVLAPLEAYGIDSILAMRLTTELEKTFGRLSKTLFFEYQTIRELAAHFAQAHAGRLQQLLAADAPSGLSAPPAPQAPSAQPAPLAAAVPRPPQTRRFLRQPSTLAAAAAARRATPAAVPAAAPAAVLAAVPAPVEPGSQPIAIVGLSGRYPEADDIDAFWRNLRTGKDCIVEVPASRWDWREYYSEDRTLDGRHYSKWGGFINGVDEFDPLFFNIPPRDAKHIDPQERVFLQHAWMAVEDAGYTRASLEGAADDEAAAGEVGVYVGVMYSEYQMYGVEASLRGQRMGLNGSTASIANRVSYCLNLHGPSMTLDTMCSSSLTAIHLACQDLRGGRTRMAIAGGVNLSVHPNKYLLLSGAQFISSDGQCQSFGEGGNGYIPGEGVGAVVLKRLSDALQDGDHIHGLIRGSALSHGGKTNGFSVPNPRGQANAIRRALHDAGVQPRQVSYVEAHGTGTKLGDPIEIAALSMVFAQADEPHYCPIGSVKSNIGHCESAAGIAGLTKVLLQMKHREIVPSLHSTRLNPHIDFRHSPFIVNQTLKPWEQPLIDGQRSPRIAGLSSFGAGGSNAHLVVEEYIDATAAAQPVPAAGPVAILLSARTPGQLEQKARSLLALLRTEAADTAAATAQPPDLAAMAYTLQVGREAMDERLSLMVSSPDELASKLQAHLAGQDDVDGVSRGQARRNREALAMFSTDGDLQQLLHRWFAERKLAKLVDLWGKGVDLDWRAFYGPQQRPRRVSLPAYPFARERYWVDAATAAVPAAGAGSVLHPLLHRNTSTLSQHSHASVFSGRELFFADRETGLPGSAPQRVLGESAALAMALQALLLAQPEPAPGTALELQELQWAQPFMAAAGRQVEIALSLLDDGSMPFEIYSGHGDGEVVHCQGLARHVPLQDNPPLDLAPLRARLGPAGDAAGPGLRSLRVGTRELLAELALPAEVETAHGEAGLLWSHLDAALRASALLAGAGAGLPLALQTLRLVSPCSRDAWAWVRSTGGALDLDILDAQGQALLQLRGLALGAAGLAAPLQALQPDRDALALSEPAQQVAPAAGPSAPSSPSPSAPSAPLTSFASSSPVAPSAPSAPVAEPREVLLDLPASAAAAPVPLQRAKPAGVALLPPAAALPGPAPAAHRVPLTLPDPALRPPPAGSAAFGLVRLFDHGGGVFCLRVAASDGTPLQTLADAVLGALQAVQREPAAQVLLLCGTASHFLASSQAPVPAALEHRLFAAVLGFPLPVVAAVQGAASGTGFLLGLLCDFMVCSEDAHCSLRALPGFGAIGDTVLALLHERLGATLADDLVALPAGATGGELRAKGWSCAIVPALQVEAVAQALAGTLAAQPGPALRLLKPHLARRLLSLLQPLLQPPVQPPVQPLVQPLVQPPMPDSADAPPPVAGQPDMPAAALVWQSGDSHLHVQAEADGLVLLRIDAPADSAGLGALRSALAQVFAQMEASSACSAVVLASDGPLFMPTVSEDDALQTAAELHRLVLGCRLPVVAALAAGARDMAWLAGLWADRCVYDETAVHSIAADRLGPQWAALAAALLAHRLGDNLGREILLSGGSYSGARLHARCGVVTAVAPDDVVPQAVALARAWCQLPRPTLLAWKQASSQALQARLRQLPPWQELAEGPWASTPDQATPVPLHSQVVNATAHPGGVLLVRMEDRASRNMFTPALVAGLQEAFDHAERTPGCKVLVLTGHGSCFASGGTLDSLLAIQEGKARFTDIRSFDAPLRASLPVIAALQGHAIGAGWALGMFADLSLLSEDARYLSPYMDYGFTPGAGATLVFPQRIGLDLARETLFTARPYTGRELRERGIALPVLAADQVLPAAMELAQQLARLPRARLQALKAQFAHPLRQQVEEACQLELLMHEQTFVGRAHTLQRIQQRFTPLPQAGQAGQAEPAPAPAAQQQPATPAEPAATLTAGLKALLAQELQMREDDIDDGMQFVDLGLDSISGVTWVRKINERYGTAIEATQIYSHPTLLALSAYVRQQVPQPEVPAAAQQPDWTPQPVEQALPPAVPVPPAVPIAAALRAPVLRRATNRATNRRAVPAAVATLPPPDRREMPAEHIAVIGMAGQFPQARDVQAFWHHIASGHDCIGDVPADRWHVDAHYAAGEPVVGKTNSRWLGALQDHDCFDPLFFNISPSEAECMDPQQRLFLQACWHGIEDAGYDARALSGSRCGVFVGCAASDYHQQAPEQRLSAQGFTGGASSILAARISYFLNLQGPCLAIDTACSSSLVAIAHACDSLIAGNCQLALAGGVYVMSGPEMHIKTAQAGMLSPDGRCFAFDQRANGFVPGEAVGVVLLKRLADAQRDGDTIHGVVRGWGVNQDGKTNGITAPNPGAQARLLREVYQRHQIDPGHIQLVEAHGTGTKLGDPIEVQGLKEAFGPRGAPTAAVAHCALGSVKSNIGHCLTAAGIAGFIKLLQALRHRQLPPTIQFSSLNEHIHLQGSPFYINGQLRPWPARHGGGPRLAAISSFGFSGTNAHVVVQEHDAAGEPARLVHAVTQGGRVIVPLSARTPQQLRQQVQALLAHLREPRPGLQLLELAYTLQAGREAMDERLAFLVDSLDALAAALRACLDTDLGSAGADAPTRSVRKARHLDETATVAAVAQMRACTASRDLQGLMELWLQGLPVDWQLLYADGQTPRRISLPLYPFAKERYGLPPAAPAASPHQPPAQAPAWLHPLLQANTSILGEQRYSTCFARDAFNFAGGQPALPAAVQLAMACAALVQAMPGRAAGAQLQLRDLVWGQGFVPAPARWLHVSVLADAADAARFELSSGDTAAPDVHCTGHAEWLPPLELASAQAQAGHGQRWLPLPTPGADGAADGTDDGLPPPALHAVLQAAATLWAELQGAAAAVPLQPQALHGLRIVQAGAGPLSAWLRAASGPGVDADVRDAHGHVLLQLRGLSFVAAEAAAEPAGTLLAVPAWQALAAPQPHAGALFGEHVVVLCGSSKVSPGELAALVPASRCVQWPALKGLDPAQRHAERAWACLQTVQQMLRSKPQGRVLLQLVLADEPEAPLLAGLSGLLKTAALEAPQFAGQLIFIDPQTSTRALARLLQGEAAAPQETLVRHLQGRREVQRWHTVPGAAQVPLLFKEHGVYLVTGGLGALGLLLARDILQRTRHASVVLAGRGGLTAHKQQLLQGLRAPPGRLAYLPVDLQQADSVQALVQAVLRSHGRLDGVVHAAGMIADGFILKKTQPEFMEVLAPKVMGSWNLERATQHLALDFMLLYSSVAGALGNVGQADYAAANGFMDCFAAWRTARVAERGHGGRTLAINWTLWEEGDMGIDAQALQAIRQRTGARPLQTGPALRALHQALAMQAPQCLVFEGAVDRIADYLAQLQAPAAPQAAAEAAATAVDPQQLQAQTLQKIKQLFGGVIKLAPGRIDEHQELSAYGVDSLMVTRLNAEFAKIFGAVSKTLVFEYTTLDGLCSYFVERHREQCLAWTGLQAPVSLPLAPASPPLLPASAPPAARPARLPRRAAVAPQQQHEQPIAIVGISGLYPQAPTLEQYWDNLLHARDCVTEIPPTRWPIAGFYEPDVMRAVEQGRSYCKWGGFIEQFDEFDSLFFGIAPREAMNMDPQERLFLQAAWHALENAGYARGDLQARFKRQVGVFAGITKHGYNLHGSEATRRDGKFYPRTSFGSLANRLSYFLDITGPSMPVDTMCSSALTAIHEACEHIRRGECAMAFAGAVNLYLHPSTYVDMAAQYALSRDGRCHSFGAGANGFVPGEGVGVVLLRPLADAVADGDVIHGLVLSSHVNHGGKTNGYTVPNPRAQADLVARAIEKAGIRARDISYVEAHGTGTELGDPIEIEGLRQAFGRSTQETGFCRIGSAKSNIGHLEAAAGMAGVSKILLQMKHGQIVPSLHAEQLNPAIDFSGSPFVVNTTLVPWEPTAPDGGRLPRIASISAFGAGGANAHLVLQDYTAPPALQATTASAGDGRVIVPLSARNPQQLQAVAAQLLAHIQTADAALNLQGLAYTLQVGREAMDERLSLVVDSLAMLAEKLQAFLHSGGDVEGVHRGQLKRVGDDLVTISQDEDMQGTVRTWIARRKLPLLAQLWVNGLVIDWQALHGESKPQRLCLPGYPFGKDKHWVRVPQADVPSPAAMHAPHPQQSKTIEDIVRMIDSDSIETDQAVRLLGALL